jgi:hypothetical protein
MPSAHAISIASSYQVLKPEFTQWCVPNGARYSRSALVACAVLERFDEATQHGRRIVVVVRDPLEELATCELKRAIGTQASVRRIAAHNTSIPTGKRTTDLLSFIGRIVGNDELEVFEILFQKSRKRIEEKPLAAVRQAAQG